MLALSIERHKHFLEQQKAAGSPRLEELSVFSMPNHLEAILDAQPGEVTFQSSARESCLDAVTSYLVAAQNSDGGWGYMAGRQSRVEPVCWALLALAKAAQSVAPDSAPDNTLDHTLERGKAWLRRTQSPEGFWPSHPGSAQGCWTTALASMALHALGESPSIIARGIAWLCDWWPQEGNFRWRLRALLPRRSVVQQNSALRGWSWVPGTASWVEPTAYVLILLRNTPSQMHPAGAAQRIQLAEAMLYDRMCPEGGWNLGNPRVYGVAGVPRIGPTVWALLALQKYVERKENQQSLSWLEGVYGKIPGLGSLALARLCLQAYERPLPPIELLLLRLRPTELNFSNIPTLAWATLALQPGADFLCWAGAK